MNNNYHDYYESYKDGYQDGIIKMYNIFADLFQASCDFDLTKSQFTDLFVFKMKKIKEELEN